MRNVTTFDEPGARVRLASISTRPPAKISKGKAKERFESLNDELFELQDLLWGAKTHSLLVVLQGRDAAGKDGTIKHVAGALNPRGVHVTSFGVPSAEERAHDFLWRVHRVTPPLGEVAIFNRSHYEDVLVVRVHELVKKALWKTRYDAINAFESTLAEHGCIVLKYFLHISKGDQEERLLEREEDSTKAWKLNVEDWKERDRWEEFTKAYEDAISRCSAPHAPWMIVPADAKWYRNLVVAESIVAALRPYKAEWEKTLEVEGKKRGAELAAWREQRAAGDSGKEVEHRPTPRPRPTARRKRVTPTAPDGAAKADAS
ncbi:MAG: PPK2 family polyphosphate kinase [Myxococcales bacterium]